MASSGSFNTSAYSERYLTFSWSVASQDVTNNKTVINYTLKGNGGSTSSWYTSGNFKLVIDGTTVYSSSTRINLYSGTTVCSGQYTISHNSDGSRSFSASAEAGIYYVAVNCSGSGSWSLPTIPRASKINSFSGTNIDGSFSVSYTSYSSSFTNKLRLSIPNVKSLQTTTYSSGTSFTLDSSTLSYLYSYMESSKTVSIGAVIETYNGSTKIGESSELVNTCSVTNCNPTFTSSLITYEDSNATTTAVTEDNQQLVQNLSNLLVTIGSATGNKGASISNYVATINGVSKTITSAGDIDFGVINASNDLTLSVTVTDSRGYTTTATKTITFLAWILPSAIISLKRKNNYEDESYLTVDATYSSVNGKNALSIQYQRKKTTDSDYEELEEITDNEQITVINDKDYAWNYRIILTDKFGTTTYNVILPKGKFILFVDTKKLSVGINCFPEEEETLEVNGNKFYSIDKIYPVGSIYMSVNDTNPSMLFGGTWEQIKDSFLLSAGDTYSAGTTGGSSNHTHNYGLQVGAYYRNVALESNSNAGILKYDSSGNITLVSTGSNIGSSTAEVNSSTTGSSSSKSMSHYRMIGNTSYSSTLPPYLTVYIWKRIE